MRRWLPAWIATGAVVGLAAPVAVLVVDRRDEAVRRALLPSVAALGAQAVLERRLTAAGRGDTIRVVGATGTAARLALLAVAWRSAPGRRRARAVIAANAAFWSANLVVLAKVR